MTLLFVSQDRIINGDKILYITKAKQKQLYVVKFDTPDKDDTQFLTFAEYDYLIRNLQNGNSTQS